jgi:alanyl-tRNA synthetase
MDLKAALQSGAMALFGEKYGDRVRVIRIGDFSTELCGGTHLGSTGEIGLFKVVSEGAVASGVRRMEAVTGEAALRHVGEEEAALRESAGLLKIPPLELPQRLQKLLDENRQLQRQVRESEAREAKSRARELAASPRTVAGIPVLSMRFDDLDAEGLRSVIDTLREQLKSGVISVGSSMDGKATLVTSVSKDLTKRIQAGKIMQEIAPLVGGKGGGRPDLAQGGGPNVSNLDKALARVDELIQATGSV